MWRWILAIVGIVILALVGTCYTGFRKIVDGGNTLVTTLAGPPARPFALLTDRDSLLAWMPEGTTLHPDGHGAVHVGDSIRVATSSGRALELWVVRDVKTDVFAIEAFQFDRAGVPRAAFTRRDSVFAADDSTQIVSTFVAAPLVTGRDSARATSGAVSGSLLTTAERMRVGAARLMWQGQLRRLVRRAGS